MKNLLLEEFKVWLEDNNYGFVTTPLNTKHSAMFESYKGGKSSQSSVRENLLNK